MNLADPSSESAASETSLEFEIADGERIDRFDPSKIAVCRVTTFSVELERPPEM
jgi:hypothetical protein